MDKHLFYRKYHFDFIDLVKIASWMEIFIVCKMTEGMEISETKDHSGQAWFDKKTTSNFADGFDKVS